MTTSINGTPAPWTPEIWQLWYTYVERADPKLYANEALPKTANYFTPRPYVDQYNRGSNREGFTYTFGRDWSEIRVCQVAWRSFLVHAFSQGRVATALCGRSNDDDGDAPATEDWAKVTCAACIRKRKP